MSSSTNAQVESPAPFELKAGNFTLPVLRLLGADMDQVSALLGEKVEQAGGFFHNAPVVIDLKAVAGAGVEVEFPLLVGLMRGYGMIPVGVRGGDESQNSAAEALELAILGDSPTPRRVESGPKREEPKIKPATVHPGTKMVTRPVRSGQRVYASGGDLVVLAQVSSGAEVMADGHVHIYAPLRGRALAGVKGNLEARIFCNNLQAELISVAGHYRISENIPADLKGQPVQIYLQERSLIIEPT